MKYILKISLIAFFSLFFMGKQALAQSQPPDSTLVIVLDTLRVVYIYADTAKALNRLDKYGKKQGMWEQKFPNGKIRYKGRFKDDKPVGIFKYFYEDNDSLRILAIYSENGKVSRVHEYYYTGAMASSGKYVNQQKDSVWKIYDERQNLREKDQYSMGKKDGKCVTFYPDGNVLESKTWQNDLENGKRVEYYDNGEMRLEESYVNGKVEGPASFYSDEGKLVISGAYKNDVKDGKWIYYNEEGHARDSVMYKNGRLLNKDKLTITPAQEDSMKRQYQEEKQNSPKQIGEDPDYGN
ncbi:MAG TPA: toxin-antitoxin system YwqK family antitoxin [Bacteroidia bacterium]|jgi:antitoxin component YwqK of YwqJK toxin-antitoxin module|nr:toxin-antitoxin system YwqK family antitoxin [Bacteroidia bacterium]